MQQLCKIYIKTPSKNIHVVIYFWKFIIPYIVTFVHRQPFQRDMENDEFDVRKTKPFLKTVFHFTCCHGEFF